MKGGGKENYHTEETVKFDLYITDVLNRFSIMILIEMIRLF